MIPFITLGLSLLSLFPTVYSSPISHVARNHTSPTPLLKNETYLAIEYLLNSTNTPGAVLVTTHGEYSEVKTFGVKNVNGDPVTADTYWGLASNSKLFTALTVNLLVDQEIQLDNGDTFSLESRLVDFVPGFEMWNKTSTPEIKVIDLLTHYTGLPGTNAAVNDSWTAEDWMSNLPYFKQNLPPHTAFQYSNINFALAARVVEIVTNQTFYDVVQELVFDPLNITGTWNASAVEDKSQGFFQNGINSTACGEALAVFNSTTAILPEECLSAPSGVEYWTEGSGQGWSGGGAAVLSGNDLVKWERELLTPTVFPAETIARIQKAVYGRIAQGCFSVPYRGYNLSLHDGALPGTNSYFVRVPNETIATFLIVNDDAYGVLIGEPLTNLVLDDLLNLPPANTSLASPGANDAPVEAVGPIGPPVNATPTPDLTGVYTHPAYSDLVVSLIDLTNSTAIEEAGFPLRELQVGPATSQGVDFTREVYHAKWNQSFANHAFFTPFDGNLINVTHILTWERAKGDFEIQSIPANGSQYVSKYMGGGPAVWSESEGGIGIFGNWWTQNTDFPFPEATEVDVEASAEVFFKKRAE